MNSDPGPSSSTTTSTMDSFTTTDFINKVKQTVALAREIQKHPASKNNEKVQELLRIQSLNSLKLLTKLNRIKDGRRDSCDFTRAKFDDEQKIAKLTEINDALVDKTIHYFECVRNSDNQHMMNTKNLIQVKMNVPKNQDAKIKILDHRTGTIPRYLKRSSEQDQDDCPAKKRRPYYLVTAPNIPRLQIVYQMKIDNAYSSPFVPRLTKKPNAMLPLEKSLDIIPIRPTALSRAMELEGINFPQFSYPHPYKLELENFEPKPEFLNSDPNPPKKPVPVEDTAGTFRLISKRDELEDLVRVLRNYQEIAVDVEHHSFRSYQGITCLLQISTDDMDYIIDVFPLWNDLELLNEIFTSPDILKVFHSSTQDMIWLQRDLGLYVVNLFDTWKAATILNFDHLSLSSLLDRYLGIKMDKRYQLADWRIRPIPDEMLHYARCDTHFLLYIYRRMKQELLDQSNQSANLLRAVMEQSKQFCLQKYEKKLPESNDYIQLLWRNNLRFNGRQIAALKSLYRWRDMIARQEDESIGYVLPNNLLLKICEILPREQQGILACCNPIPPLVKQYINEIHKIVVEARSRISSNEPGLMAMSKVPTAIDISDDLLMQGVGVHGSYQHINGHHDDDDDYRDSDERPLLCWSAETKSFITTGESRKPMNVDDQKSGQQEKSIDGIRRLFNTFQIASQYDSVTNAKNKSNETRKKLFEGYTTFYQKYVLKMEQNQRRIQEKEFSKDKN